MPFIIPETMPDDWLMDGAQAAERMFDDPELGKVMRAAYEDALVNEHIAGMRVRLRNECLAAAARLIGR